MMVVPAFLVLVLAVADSFTASLPRPSMIPAVTASPRTTAELASSPDAKVCLITGSSRGLGKSIALDLARYGQKVIVNYVLDRSKPQAESTVDGIKALGGDALAIKADSKCKFVIAILNLLDRRPH